MAGVWDERTRATRGDLADKSETEISKPDNSCSDARLNSQKSAEAIVPDGFETGGKG